MQTYLAVPGEVLASASLSQLLADMQEAEGSGGTDSAVGAAGSSKRSSNKGSSKCDRQPQRRWYKGADLMVLRR